MTPDELKSILEQDYNRGKWLEALRDILNIQNIYEVPKPIELGKNDFDAKAVELGYFDTSEGLRIGIYEVTVSPKVRLDRNKVGLRNLLRRVYQEEGDAAQIVFTHGDTWRFTYASELTVVNKDTGLREKKQTDPKRYTYVFGRNQHCRTAAERFTSIKTTTNLLGSRISISEIEKAFSVDTLTKDFYRELSNWYFWALTKIEFPEDAEKDKEIRNSTNTIRLITRLIFVWFLKQKKLIPDILFEKDKVFSFLNLLDRSHSTYYKSILQNLFFATLNQEMGKRSFRNEKQHFNITNLYRYRRYFKEPSKILEIFSDIPFLNGGLFECLDKPHPSEKTPQGNERIIRIDGFSDRDDNKICVPDYLFFGGAADVDLSEAYDDTRQKHLKIRGIIDILNSYNFTVEENTPLDIQVALDPELLGKVFENLLASYNPETKSTARKQTGSFYTPREIVSYMVDESLKAYFTERLTEELEVKWRQNERIPFDDNIDPNTEMTQLIADKKKVLEGNIASLLAYNEDFVRLAPEEIPLLIMAVDQIKVLDPACGSGAFPMGVLQQLVHVLQKVDPTNRQWKMLQMEKASKELQSAMDSNETESFSATLKEISETFDYNSSDYGRKLFLIENCIYGVDIQPIAVQIAKLRFFISLLCEQDPNPGMDNLGIKPLPNLETKFVAANTLVGLDTSVTLKPDAVYPLEKQLKEVRHRHFNARTPETKRKYREQDKDLRKTIADILKDADFPETSADQIAGWNPYDQNATSPFFDKYWMFGLLDGFDIVIGNPPYYLVKENSVKQYLKSKFKTLHFKINLFVCFIEQGVYLAKGNGFLTYIIPNLLFANDSLKLLREMLCRQTSIQFLLNLGDGVFENVTMPTMVFLLKQKIDIKNKFKIYPNVTESNLNGSYYLCSQSDVLKNFNYVFETTNPQNKELIDKISSNTVDLETVLEINQGIITGNDSEYLSENKTSNRWKQTLRGRDIEGYRISYPKLYVYYSPDHLACPRSVDLFEADEKLVMRRTGDYPVVAYDNRQTYNLHTLYSCRKKGIVPLKFILALLNSTLIRYSYLQKLGTEAGRIFAEIKILYIRKLPIKIPKTTEPFLTLVDKIISAKSEKKDSDTSKLEKKIDELVYKLYDLSYNEVKIIDPDFWLSEEEYDEVKIY